MSKNRINEKHDSKNKVDEAYIKQLDKGAQWQSCFGYAQQTIAAYGSYGYQV